MNRERDGELLMGVRKQTEQLKTLLVATCVAAAIALALGGCGSAGGHSTSVGQRGTGTSATHNNAAKAAYITKADAICTAEHHIYETFPLPHMRVTESGESVHDNVAVIGHALQRMLAAQTVKAHQLQALPRPAADHRLLALIFHQSAGARHIGDQLLDLMEHFPARISVSDVAEAKRFETRAASIGVEAARIAARVQQLAKRYGFKVCGTTPPPRNLGGSTGTSVPAMI